MTRAVRAALTSRGFFAHLISAPFHDGLVIVFATSAALSAIVALASLLRGKRATTMPTTEGVPS